MSTLEWDRGVVRSWIEDASNVDLPVTDSLPDTLIAQAQALGLEQSDILPFLWETTPDRYTSEGLTAWAREMRGGA
jgi:hypothetical protein